MQVDIDKVNEALKPLGIRAVQSDGESPPLVTLEPIRRDFGREAVKTADLKLWYEPAQYAARVVANAAIREFAKAVKELAHADSKRIKYPGEILDILDSLLPEEPKP